MSEDADSAEEGDYVGNPPLGTSESKPLPEDFGLTHQTIKKYKELSQNEGVPSNIKGVYVFIMFGWLLAAGISDDRDFRIICLVLWFTSMIFCFNNRILRACFKYRLKKIPESYFKYSEASRAYGRELRESEELKRKFDREIEEERQQQEQEEKSRRAYEYWNSVDPYDPNRDMEKIDYFSSSNIKCRGLKFDVVGDAVFHGPEYSVRNKGVLGFFSKNFKMEHVVEIRIEVQFFIDRLFIPSVLNNLYKDRSLASCFDSVLFYCMSENRRFYDAFERECLYEPSNSYGWTELADTRSYCHTAGYFNPHENFYEALKPATYIKLLSHYFKPGVFSHSSTPSRLDVHEANIGRMRYFKDLDYRFEGFLDNSKFHSSAHIVTYENEEKKIFEEDLLEISPRFKDEKFHMEY